MPLNANTEQALVHLLSALLDRSEASIRNDPKAYGAFELSDDFLEHHRGIVDLRQGRIDEDPQLQSPFEVRTDFDPAGSFVLDHYTMPKELSTTVPGLRDYAEQTRGYIPLEHMATLWPVAGLCSEHDAVFFGKIKSGPSLLEAAAALFALDRPLCPLPFEDIEVEGTWAPMLAGIEDEALRRYFSAFFQTPPYRERRGYYLGKDDLWKRIPHLTAIASWTIGDTKELCIAELHPLPKLPALGGLL